MGKDINQDGAYSVNWQKKLEDEGVSFGGAKSMQGEITLGTNADDKSLFSETIHQGSVENIPLFTKIMLQVSVPTDYTFTPDMPVNVAIVFRKNDDSAGRGIATVSFDDDTTAPTADLQIFPGQNKTYVMVVDENGVYNGNQMGTDPVSDDGFYHEKVNITISGVGTAGPSGDPINCRITALYEDIPSISLIGGGSGA